MNQLLPTTKAQVSGHKFLLRRAEHGVEFGDIRMIHDPLGRRRRSLALGGVAVILTALGAGALAVFHPAADPGDAPIVVADSGAHYVRVGEQLHPVANLASARLITGGGEAPARASDGIIAGMPRGVPLGILDAPGVLAEATPQDAQWSVCHHSNGQVVVAHGSTPAKLGEREAVLARTDEGDFAVTAHGRARLPDAQTPEGRAIRRRLGIRPDTGAWEPPNDVLAALTELPPWQPPAGPLEIFTASDGSAWLVRYSGITRLSATQRDVLLDLGAKSTPVAPAALADHADAAPEPIGLPESPYEWLDSSGGEGTEPFGDIARAAVCVVDGGGARAQPEDQAPDSGVALSGDSVATRFVSAGVGGVGVDTGHGFGVVADTGRRHAVADRGALAALGVTEPQPAPWGVLRLLPQGSPLTRDEALAATY